MGKMWEYDIYYLDKGIEGLNKKGKEGWEAVAAYGDGMQTVVRVLLKREVEEKLFE